MLEVKEAFGEEVAGAAEEEGEVDVFAEAEDEGAALEALAVETLEEDELVTGLEGPEGAADDGVVCAPCDEDAGAALVLDGAAGVSSAVVAGVVAAGA